MAKIAVYPGSFDPITNGHIDVIKRASKVFDHLIVAVLVNDSKKSMFTLDERLDILKHSIDNLDNVSFDSFSGLLVDYCKEKQLSAIVRGLRAISDFEFELQMAQMNRQLYDETETVFFTTSEQYSYLSSSLVKEVAKFGGKIDGLIPDYAIMKMKQKLSRGE
ncbi:Phosphopantetheine adenylyltransferase [Acetoanaerobium noterae]|jgi:pantetheine-phosphate adenylyltransferase|uniref:Phosphopantetheine adenylyltransferase n=2 Tax=root TaxID=1 RepID=A0A1T4ZZE3_9FIRM|nr:pantetheine-phosphate adenylyltransferase [Acetoanaerobium noterae]MBP8763651.1 pantetheine-phosphate adenylyltransferase [Acetoanaerobium sp.]MBP9500002.1 pantetheine-phosphate adenylyltransferase [Acetoanaerobium sp.]MDK2803113.1 pantetheine-phosphate adenylyltransferase [Peptostreptococcaceae bacterium]SKB27965.1 Phosphopantetheine adenylyltransferase [Acetoanaerobium noterae]